MATEDGASGNGKAGSEERGQAQAQVTLQAWVRYAPGVGSGSGKSEATGTGWTQDQAQWWGIAHVGWVPVW